MNMIGWYEDDEDDEIKGVILGFDDVISDYYKSFRLINELVRKEDLVY